MQRLLKIWIITVSLSLWLPCSPAYAADGTPVWTNYFNGTGNAQDGVTAMALDANGNVYVTGYSDGNGTGQDFATIKYAANGTTLWVSRFNGPGNDYDYPNALAVDAGGNVYVAGTSYDISAGGYNYATIKYTAAGTPVWTNYYSSSGFAQDQVTSVAVDASGNVFVSGVSGYSGGGSYDFVTIKYSSAGVAAWTNRFGVANPTFERVSLGLDATGNAYISGSSAHGAEGFDYATLKYSSSGVALWTNIYPAGGYYNDRAKILAVDAVGNVFVTGSSLGIGGDQDFATIKYSTDGTPLWTNRFNGTGNGADRLPVITADADGSAIVTGYSTGVGNDLAYATIKYSSTGIALWTNFFNGVMNSVDFADDVCTDDSGNVYVIGFSSDSVGYWDNVAIKYSPTGTAVWTNAFHAKAYDPDSFPALLKVDHAGNVYAAGSIYDSNGQANFFTVKYSGPATPIQFLTSGGNPGYTTGQLSLTLTGPANSNVVISASSDLQNWNPLTTNQLTGGTLRFTDTAATNYSRRFYRATLQ